MVGHVKKMKTNERKNVIRLAKNRLYTSKKNAKKEFLFSAAENFFLKTNVCFFKHFFIKREKKRKTSRLNKKMKCGKDFFG
jgi:hypothetical protein